MIDLIPIELQHADLLRSWRNDPAISRFMYANHDATPDEHAAWMELLVSHDDRLGWIIRLDGNPVGAAFITPISREHSNAMWAFYLADPSVRGRGVGSFVEAWILTYSFEKLRLHKLSCEVLDFNSGVIAMHKRFGFHEEGIFRQDKLKDGEWRDVHRLAFFASDWEQRRSELAAIIGGPID